MERIINTRLNWLLEINNIMANKQAGFRIHRTTNEHTAKFSQFIKDALGNKRILTAVFIDFKLAYDSVWKENLLKLVRFGIRSNLLQWLESFISNRAYYSKYHILQTGLPQGAVTSCTLFNLYINDLTGELYSISGIKCLLYADDLALWTEVDKRKAEEQTEHKLSKALTILEEWCERNNMKINTSKTAFQSFSLSHKTIHPRLRYKGTALSQSNEFKYHGQIFHNKINWKNRIDKIASRVSKRTNVLRRLAGSKWGCALSTLTLTYQKYILPVLTYSREPLVTAQPHRLKMLEHAQNQALRPITGAMKTTPIDAMTFTTGNKPIQELIKEKAVLLHEKLLRIPGDQYWKTYENRLRNLKTQNGFIQKVTEIKSELEIKSQPQPLHQRRNPVDVEQGECYIHLQQNILKGETGTNLGTWLWKQ